MPRPTTLRELALRYLRDRIVSGALAPGARLSDLLLAREMGISRTPVREAIQQLAADGLAEIIPHAGALVRRVDAAELDELYELRSLLEGHAAALAAGRAAQAGALAELTAAMAELQTVDGLLGEADSARQRELDLAFHRRVLELSGRRRLQRLVEDAGVITRPFEAARPTRLHADELASAIAHHRAITDAILRGDAEGARRAMTAHIAEAQAQCRQRLAAAPPPGPDVPPALRPFA